MDNQNSSVNLKKPEPWTDPATGEVYPGGNPNGQNPGVMTGQNASGGLKIETQPTGGAPVPVPAPIQQSGSTAPQTKFCKFCGSTIPFDAVVCTACGRQVEALQGAQPQQIIVNNSSTMNANPVVMVGNHVGKPKSKWLAFILCFFFGEFGVHRFYEGKVGTGLLWLFTLGLFGIGWLIDLIIILTKSDPYYV